VKKGLCPCPCPCLLGPCPCPCTSIQSLLASRRLYRAKRQGEQLTVLTCSVTVCYPTFVKDVSATCTCMGPAIGQRAVTDCQELPGVSAAQNVTFIASVNKMWPPNSSD